MRSSFTLVVSDVPAMGRAGASVPHYMQQTGFTCGAASMSMITGFTEAECRRLANTTRRGTHTSDVVAALNRSGFKAHLIRIHDDYDRHIVELTEQSMRWPLYLVLEYKNRGTDSIGRKRTRVSHHAVVMSQGQILDPGELHPLDPEALGASANAGLWLREYILVEKSVS